MLKLFEVQNNTPEHRPYELLLALSVCHPLTFSIFFIIFYRTFESLTNDDGSQVFKFVCISAVKDHVTSAEQQDSYWSVVYKIYLEGQL